MIRKFVRVSKNINCSLADVDDRIVQLLDLLGAERVTVLLGVKLGVV